MSANRGRTFDPAPLLALRELRGLSDPQIADRLGVSKRTVMRWRHGTHRAEERTADRVAARLDLHPMLIWDEWETAA